MTQVTSMHSFATERVSVTGIFYSEKGEITQHFVFGDFQEETCLDIAELNA